MRRARQAEITHLEALVPFLGTTASASPFVGIFGTVMGLIHVFPNLGRGGHTMLIASIGETLIATAAGIFAAVPALVAYNYLVRRIKVLDIEMENFSADLANIVQRHLL